MKTYEECSAAEIYEAKQSASLSAEARIAIKNSQPVFINLGADSEDKYVNTLDENAAYIQVSRCYHHRVGNHEKLGITVSLTCPLGSSSVFLAAPQVWATFLVYGGTAIDHRYYSVLPAKEVIDRAIDQMRRKYDAISGR